MLALLEPGKVASIYFYHYERLGHPTLLMAWNAATPEFVVRGTLMCQLQKPHFNSVRTEEIRSERASEPGREVIVGDK